MLQLFSSELSSNTLPSNSQGGKPKKRLDFSPQAQLFCSVYSLILENAQSVLSFSVRTLAVQQHATLRAAKHLTP